MAGILFNGDWIDDKKSTFMQTERLWQFGEGLFESIRVINGNIPLIKFHSERLYNSSRVLGWAVPPFWNKNFWTQEIGKYCKKNKWKNARIKIILFRQGNGTYLPGNSFFYWIITGKELSSDKFELNGNGIKTVEYSKIPKSEDVLSLLKTTSSLRYVQSALYARQFGADEVLTANQAGRICEAGASNLFIVQGGEVLTPPLSEYCLNGVMRKYIIEIATKNGIKVFETPLFRDDIKNAEEIFLTNAIKGIQWVAKFEEKEFEQGKITKRLIELLNKSIE